MIVIAEILCVGNELLSGITLNSNAHWLAGQIAQAGGMVRRVTVATISRKYRQLSKSRWQESLIF
jgi:molybdopterin-biosynthesis enzyme MoeA-like protein